MEKLRNVAFAAALLGGLALGAAGTASAKDGFVCSGDMVKGKRITSEAIVDRLQIKEKQKFLFVGKSFGGDTMGVIYNHESGRGYLVDTKDKEPLDNGIWDRARKSQEVCFSSQIGDIDLTAANDHRRPLYLEALKPNIDAGIDVRSSIIDRQGVVLISGRFTTIDGKLLGKKFLLVATPASGTDTYAVGSDGVPDLLDSFETGFTTTTFNELLPSSNLAIR